ncbi:M48 family metallopeptidase [Rhizobium sp. S95]|uniref:M48 family metallopeptidase n=1 Tax=Ciceribacter sichuanensis TaxID=2949647 RepID=A0AAJ1BS51_9HYPH|nr:MULTISPECIES: M48 family metallopeptidase [unclassified Ciceribacter]MCM2394778.1 M48 family metallopeptidase [Ciceribacter sp. S95]MCO5955199.1 M48 family metallopeptidase [Ciceribacter sp. S101]
MASEATGSEARIIARGHWHPPRSSKALAATLFASDSTLLVRLEGEAAGDPAAFNDARRVTISDRVGNIPRRVGFVDGSTFETADNDAVDAWLRKTRSRHHGFVHELERFHPRLIAFVLGIVLLGGLVYRFALPALVEVAVAVTPPVVPKMMSSGTLASLDQAVFSKSGLPEERQRELTEKFEALAAYSVRGKDGYDLNFRKGGLIGPNAFALPDGTLVITDELIDLAAGDSEMILGVLAHEIGHVEKTHSLRQLYRAAGMAGLVMLIAGDIGSVGEDILTNGAALISLSYSRSAESEADHVSVELMAKAGHDPAAIGRFFELIEKKLGDSGETSILSTHPGTPERRRQIDEWAKEIRK